MTGCDVLCGIVFMRLKLKQERGRTMAKQYIHIITVKSDGLGEISFPFPIDMLRYDSCYPRTERDSGKIMETHSMGRMVGEVGNIEVITIASRAWAPAKGRWKSFQWTVVEHKISHPV